jgi:hypothetical protein
MKTEQKAPSKPLDYGAGALIVLVASLGVVAIVYGLPLLTFNLFNLPAWIFGPLGIYTLAYSLIAKKDSTYYLVWGSIMLAVAIIFVFYNPLVILGVLAIVIAIIGIVAYQRSKK